MSKFITVTIKQANLPPQGFEPITFTLSTDAILLIKQRGPDGYWVTLKPEYEPKIREALGIHQRAEIEYIKITPKDAATLLQ